MAFETTPLFQVTGDERPTAVVVAVQLPGVTDGELASSMEELERLATTLGLEPITRITQRGGRLAPGSVVGDGKLKEVAEWTGGTGEVPTSERPGTKKKEFPGAEDGDDEDEDEDEGEDNEADDDTAEPGEKPTAKAKVVLVDHDLSPTQQ